MQLVMQLLDPPSGLPSHLLSMSFTHLGGIIGRSHQSEWCLPDTTAKLSGRHAHVTYQDGAFHLTDLSQNGIWLQHSQRRLEKARAYRIEDGTVYQMSDFKIVARLTQPVEHQTPSVGIPEDYQFDLSLDRQDQQPQCEPLPAHMQDHAPLETQHFPLPTLMVEAEPTPPPIPTPPAPFWQDFGAALGVDLRHLDEPAQKAVAIKAARLLRLSVAGVHQCLHTCSGIKNEMGIPPTIDTPAANAPSEAPLEKLLLSDGTNATVHLKEQLRSLQSHQLATLAASRAAWRGALEQWAPNNLALHFEQQEPRRRLFSNAGYWRAYCRFHQELSQQDSGPDRLWARHFVQAYTEQQRLLNTLSLLSSGER